MALGPYQVLSPLLQLRLKLELLGLQFPFPKWAILDPIKKELEPRYIGYEYLQTRMLKKKPDTFQEETYRTF